MGYGTKKSLPPAGKADHGRSESKKEGVGIGKADGEPGGTSTFNTGRSEGVCYSHNRKAYKREDKAD